MTNQFSMFDIQSGAPTSATNPPQTKSYHNGAAALATTAASNVLRIVQHKEGPFIELKRNGDGEPTGRTYRYVETIEHALYVEFSDGERKPGPALLGLHIEDGIQNGTWIEVEA